MTSVPHSGAKSVTPGGSVAGGAGHTAERWGVEVGTNHLWIGPLKSSGSKVGDIVVSLEYGPNYTLNYCARQEANARLIAAAPELLSVARLALKTILDAAEARDFEPPADPILIAELEAAIAKATAGETRNAEPIHRRDGDEG